MTLKYKKVIISILLTLVSNSAIAQISDAEDSKNGPVRTCLMEKSEEGIKLKVDYLPTYNRLWIDSLVIPANYRFYELIDSVRIEIVKINNEKHSCVGEFSLKDKRLKDVFIDNVDLADGFYLVKGLLLDKEGKIIDVVNGKNDLAINTYRRGTDSEGNPCIAGRYSFLMEKKKFKK